MKPLEILPAVSAVIFNDVGELLLQKRNDTDTWCILSGHVEFGETVAEAMLREILEETNTPAKIIRLIGVYSSPASQTYYYDHKTVQYVTTYFEAQLTQSLPPGFTNAETGELRFFRPDNIPANLAMINPHWLSDALSDNTSPFIR